MDQGLFGTKNLSRKLRELFEVSMKKDLPDIQMQVLQKIETMKNEMVKLGSDLPNDDMGKLMFLIHFTNKFSEDLKKALTGTNFSISQDDDLL